MLKSPTVSAAIKLGKVVDIMEAFFAERHPEQDGNDSDEEKCPVATDPVATDRKFGTR